MTFPLQSPSTQSLCDEHKVSRRMPYLFNGKALDSEIGLDKIPHLDYDGEVGKKDFSKDKIKIDDK
ncbi:hypothetical protein [Bergeyella sp. RCAD1439]|uniref:hypothetical protein n=1 Tax=Bergeyella anatis TaxID=3113737 RepID=UPI002E17644D|nr:hypothetical protein [Bergeyella sp. RCAD1439]